MLRLGAPPPVFALNYLQRQQKMQQQQRGLGQSASALGWRLLAVAGVLGLWVVAKLVEREEKPRLRVEEEGEDGSDDYVAGAGGGRGGGRKRAAGRRRGRGPGGEAQGQGLLRSKILGFLGLLAGADVDEEEDMEEEDEEEEEGHSPTEAARAAAAARRRRLQQAQDQAWGAVEHDFSVQQDWEKARQLVEIARMRTQRRVEEEQEEQEAEAAAAALAASEAGQEQQS